MARLNRRRGARFRAIVHGQTAVYVGQRRIEGRLIEESDRGLSIVLPHACGLRQRQPVQIMLRRTRRDAIVAYVASSPERDRVGLILRV
jgi:hypothetical protein